MKYLKSHLLGLTGGAANLWEKEIDTEWGILVIQVGLELSDLLAEHIWGVSNTSNNTETSGIGDSGSELWASGNIHASQNNWVVDLQKIGGGGADLLCDSLSAILYQEFIRRRCQLPKLSPKVHDVRGEAMVTTGICDSSVVRRDTKVLL